MLSQQIMIFALAVALLAGALFIYSRSQKEALVEKVGRRMAEASGMEAKVLLPQESRRLPWLDRLFWRAGMEVKPRQFVSGILCLLLMAILTGLAKGLAFGLAVPLAVVAVVYLWLVYKAKKRIRLILMQLPLFLDQVLRGLGTGRSMEGSLRLAAEETPDPLKSIIGRIFRANELGADLGEAIQEAANLYRIDELYLLALAIRINRSYGSSVRDLLQSVANMINEREAVRRELRSLTGETRVTAWVLGLMPPGMAAYIMIMNPKYLETMWQDPSGKIMLIVATGMQIAGAVILWRMIKSI
ncbi:type II secretion system F family protein [Methylotuvimicrobium alcaliphilum]|uniref:Type II secretion system protein n=1 Tax=Methylotuvimicrobium alcaliphilum (strain DSM 19304 / NCIMB 14124 / VKM B-2133 / 20Z) TaxID=1091494 RepID=G4T3N5_META2|nr:type II secretion system F family protein [Methylotuvimicrobium alcaliphilum]CCE24841.1 putative Type II secretion system protein [Methylotuvimicrobium alcaliphilum 20Z]